MGLGAGVTTLGFVLQQLDASNAASTRLAVFENIDDLSKRIETLCNYSWCFALAKKLLELRNVFAMVFRELRIARLTIREKFLGFLPVRLYTRELTFRLLRTMLLAIALTASFRNAPLHQKEERNRRCAEPCRYPVHVRGW